MSLAHVHNITKGNMFSNHSLWNKNVILLKKHSTLYEMSQFFLSLLKIEFKPY